MIRHFTYEIDERNLRMRLKDLEAPLKDGAWENFDAFTTLQNRHGSENSLKLKFSLNRNVVMLVVFGAVIVSFSLLLFNFITIKNPKKEIAQPLAQTPAAPVPAPLKKEVPPAPPVVKQQEPVKDTAATPVQTLAEKKQIVAEPAPVAVPEKVKEKPKEKPAVKEEKSGEELELAERKAEELKLKKEKKAAAALAKRIKPTVVTEDTDPDIRPQ